MTDNLREITEFLLYQTEDGRIRIETRMQEETVWLSQAQMCQLFDKNKRTVSEHIRNIFKEGELHKTLVVRKFRTTARDGKKGKKLLSTTTGVRPTQLTIKQSALQKFRPSYDLFQNLHEC